MAVVEEVRADTRDEAISDLIVWVIENAESWDTVSAVMQLRSSKRLTEEERSLVREVFLGDPDPAALEEVEVLLGKAFEVSELSAILHDCIANGEIEAALGFAHLLNTSLSTSQLAELLANAKDAFDSEDE